MGKLLHRRVDRVVEDGAASGVYGIDVTVIAGISEGPEDLVASLGRIGACAHDCDRLRIEDPL